MKDTIGILGLFWLIFSPALCLIPGLVNAGIAGFVIAPFIVIAASAE